MKKIHTTEELQEKAKATFEQFPTVTEVYATPDGNIFVQRNHAELHAGTQGRIIPITRPIETEAKPKASKAADQQTGKEAETLNATETVKLIKAAKTVEGLKAFEADTRETVVKALAKKRAELEATPPTGEPGTGDDTNKGEGDTQEAAASTGLGKDGKSPENRDEKTAK